MNRRQLIIYAGLHITFIPNTLNIAYAGAPRRDSHNGCTLTSAEFTSFTSRSWSLYSRSDDRVFDLALARSLTRLSDLFGVRPGFLYYDDYDGKNARASPERYTQYGPDGTVLFGTRLLSEVLSGKDNPDASVACICAHEFGHILQYKNNFDIRLNQGQPTVKRAELQADFFAGYFAGTRKKQNPSFASAVFAVTQFNYGDNNVNDQHHHGTPTERSAAIVRGFDAAYREGLSISEAISLSVAYVTSL